MDCNFNPGTEKVKEYDYYDEKTEQIIYKDVLDEDGNPKYETEYECITLDDGIKIAFVGVIYLCS